LVVDGCSSDDTVALAEKTLAGQATIRWQVLQNPKRVTPTALNLGIKAANGQFIARIDGHSNIEPDYISQCVRCINRTRAMCVGGSARPVANGFIGRAIVAAHMSPFGLGRARFRMPGYKGYADTVWPGFWHREAFEQAGFFDEQLARNQDIEHNSRIRAVGGRIYIDPSIRIWYRSRSSLSGLAKQNFANGMWNIYTILRSRGSLSLRHFVPLVFVLAVLLLGALSFCCPLARLSLESPPWLLRLYAQFGTACVSCLSCP